jgi:hypothetical protein
MSTYRKNEGEAHPPRHQEQQRELHAAMVSAHCLILIFVLVCADDRGVLVLLVMLHCNLFYLNFCCSEEAAFGDFDSDVDWEDEV